MVEEAESDAKLEVRIPAADQAEFLRDLREAAVDAKKKSKMSLDELFPDDLIPIAPGSPMQMYQWHARREQDRLNGASWKGIEARTAEAHLEHTDCRLPKPNAIKSKLLERMLIPRFKLIGCPKGLVLSLSSFFPDFALWDSFFISPSIFKVY